MNSTVGGRFIDFLSDPVMVQLVENEVNRLEKSDLGPTPDLPRARVSVGAPLPADSHRRVY